MSKQAVRQKKKKRLERILQASVHMVDRNLSEILAEFYSAFSDKTRIRIMSALQATGELSVGELAELAGASESAISHQLKLLRLLRLVASRAVGRNVYYRLDDSHIDAILSAGLEHVREKDNL